MLTTNLDNSRSSGAFRAKPTFLTICIITFMGALVGSVCGVGLTVLIQPSQLLTGALLGTIFGGWVGLVLGILLGTIRRLRESCAESRSKTIVLFVLVGSLAGAIVFFPFSEGILMALFLALEGVVIGGVISFFLSLLVPRFWPK